MTNQRYQAIKSIFLEVQDLTASDRTACLDRLCEGDSEIREAVQRLLSAHDTADDPLSQAFDAADVPMPTQIERYRVLGVLGVGGMGVVYRAEQENPKRSVALKVVRPGLMTRQMLRRFDYETQVLGRLHHPGIAQIYEAGTTQTERGPQPFFAMELVEGQPIVQHCEDGALETRERLALLVKVCQTVEHAHQKGVVHRDIKPGNILVDATGQPKILDFGIARLTDQDVNVTTIQTNVGQLMGTVPYMSPEQISGRLTDVDTRSDVYALGVLMYEMLAGRNPHDLSGTSLIEAARIISDVEPLPMSNIDPTFRGDLDTIVSKAMAKMRELRYQTASELAGDLERYLRDEPITARPPGTVYLMRKFARRNKGLVAGLSAAFVILIAGVIGMSVLAYSLNESQKKASDEAEQARIQAATATHAQEFLTSLFSKWDRRQNPGDPLTLPQVLERGVKTIMQSLSSEPQMAAALLGTMSEVYRNVGEYDRAVELAQQSLDLYVSTCGEKSEEVAASRSVLAGALHSAGSSLEAEQQHRTSLALWEVLAGHESEQAARALGNIAVVLSSLKRFDEAEVLLTEALAIHQRVGTVPLEKTAYLMSDLADIISWQERFAEAEAMYLDVLTRLRAVHGQEHPRIANALNSLGGLYLDLGRIDEARVALEQSAAMRERLVGPDDPYLLHTKTNIAFLYAQTNQKERAARLMDEVLAARLNLYSGDHMDVAISLNNAGGFHRSLGDLDKAEDLLRRSVAMRRRLVDSGQIAEVQIAPAQSTLADVLERKGALDEAESLYRENLVIRRADDEGGLNEAKGLHNLGAFLGRHGQYQEARPLLVKALDIRRAKYPPTHYNIANSLMALARTYRGEGDHETSVPMYEEALAIYQKGRPEGHRSITNAHRSLGEAYESVGQHAEALAQFRIVQDLVEQHESDDLARRIDSRSDIARILIAIDGQEEARSLLKMNLDDSSVEPIDAERVSRVACEYADFLRVEQEYEGCHEVLTAAYDTVMARAGTEEGAGDALEPQRSIIEGLIRLYAEWEGRQDQGQIWQERLASMPEVVAEEDQ
ncbi:MAG: hypothetical protein D8M59_04360 [Planctomycetes bacterium]|nr:hypothetical protein [Planctomycetota bacterium]NOG55741.1 serine/threonine protein kinase [Planctomycetota bacterium]